VLVLWKKVQTEVEDPSRYLLAVHQHVLLEEVPAARAGDDDGQVLV
jgi:hypothetical protein